MAFALGIPAAVTAGLSTLGEVMKLAEPLINRYFPDPQKALEFRNELVKVLASSDIAQLEVNKAEAQNPSLFVAGWRPAFGWLGVGLFAYAGVIAPVVEAFMAIKYPGFKMPMSSFLMENVAQLVFGMLGMGALRSFDKYQNVGTVQVGGTSPTVKLGKSLEGAR